MGTKLPEFMRKVRQNVPDGGHGRDVANAVQAARKGQGAAWGPLGA